MVDAVVAERRPLPVLDGVYAGRRVARALAGVWERYNVGGLLRADGVRELPPDLADFIEACRVVGARPPVSGTRGIPPEGESATVGSMTTSEVAAVLACSPRNVRGLRSRGRLLARRHPRKGWLFDAVDVAALIDERRRSA